MFGNSYYVGTCGITATLITGDKGHILIDGATEAGADVIIENIKNLGFSLDDVKLLLHSHEHFDHVAGLAKLQRVSGAKLLASTEAAPVLSTGITADTDPQAGMHNPFPAAKVDKIIKDGQVVSLGNLALTPISTPGHTAGALCWQWQSCENKRCLSNVYADSAQITLNIPEAEIKARLAKWQAPAPRYTRGVLAKFAKTVSSASEGAVTDKGL
ncbi:metallo-beta-lactamase [Gilvimarinus sp. 1_MG-2023]|uniref:metallo-beta-lactamase n=1 Tax=Gilvimarinus sp. 1_MG-2023 TaxID=3062638 RepID=UPI0026E269FD|nr:metallo-beta-lactamase [Gilvimarinus sp. 1_MG-2023]MDO6746551.1 metallo-beta-lactamase [Gilvimarinus sp. 1_MG-2023]